MPPSTGDVGLLDDARPVRKASFWQTRQLLTTYAAAVGIILSNIAAYRLAANWGPESWSEYAVSRRLLGLAEPILSLGFGIALARYVASVSGDSRRTPVSYFIAAQSAVLTLGMTVLTLSYWIPGRLSTIAFGTPDRSYLVFPLAVALFGSLGVTLCYVYFQGELSIVLANTLQVWTNAALPVIAVAVTRDTRSTLLLYGTVAVATATIMSTKILQRGLKRGLGSGGLFAHLGELFRYGVTRLPCDAGIALMLTAPAALAAQESGIVVAGALAFGSTILALAGASVAPIGFVLLPNASICIAQGRHSELRQPVRQLLVLYVGFGLFSIVIGQLTLTLAIQLLLGEEYLQLTRVLRIIILATAPYLIYCGFRSVIDAASTKAINARNTWIGLASGAILYAPLRYFLDPAIAIAAALVACNVVLATRTVAAVFTVIRVESADSSL